MSSETTTTPPPQKPADPPSSQRRAMAAASKKLGGNGIGPEFGFRELGDGFKRLTKEVGDVKGQVGALHLDVRKLKSGQDALYTKTGNTFAKISCLKTPGVCPPAQNPTTDVPTIEGRVQEIGRLNDDGSVTLNNPEPSRPEATREEPMTADIRPVRDLSDDEVMDELIDRQERQERRRRRRAALAENPVDPSARGAYGGQSQNDAPVDAMAQMKNELKEELATRPKWYQNSFFKTGIGGIVLFVIVFFWDDINAMIHPPAPEAPPAAAELSAEAAAKIAKLEERILSMQTEMLNFKQYKDWRDDAVEIFQEVQARIAAARERVDAVSHVAGGARLYDAEVEYLETAIQLLDEATALAQLTAEEKKDD